MAVPACVLIGIAFASLGMAGTTYMRTWSDFDMVPTLTMPMFLFSATFYPISALRRLGLAGAAQPAVPRCRAHPRCSLGDFSWALVAHAGVLLALAAVGLQVASRRVERLLLT